MTKTRILRHETVWDLAGEAEIGPLSAAHDSSAAHHGFLTSWAEPTELWRALEEVLGDALPTTCRSLSARDWVRASQWSVEELEARFTLRRESALRLRGAFRLARILERAQFAPKPSLRSPERVFRLMRGELRGHRRERFFALHLDSKHRLFRRRLVSTGTLTTSLVHPREVFGPALSDSAAALIVVHNHPSGDASPSQEDLDITRRLIDAGRLLGVPLLDHVIVGETEFTSLREQLDFST